MFLRNFLESIGYPQQTTVLHADNMAANFLSLNAKISARTKHIDIKFHHVRELQEKGQVKVQHIGTKFNIADLCTKPLPKTTLYSLLEKYMFMKR